MRRSRANAPAAAPAEGATGARSRPRPPKSRLTARIPAPRAFLPAFLREMTYAIIRLAGKQYRVQEGDRILVDRLGQDEGKTFHPDVLLFADNGKTELAPKGVQVTAK